MKMHELRQDLSAISSGIAPEKKTDPDTSAAEKPEKKEK